MKKNYKNLKVVVSGGDGFIGSHLVKTLIDLGAELYCVIEPGMDLWRVKEIEDKINIIECDICGPGLRTEIKKINPDKAFHLASLVNASRDMSLLDDMLRVNVSGAMNFMLALKDTDCEAIVNTGTCEEYGDNKAPFREKDLPSPVSPYSASKAAATFYCGMLYRSFKMPIVTARPFLTYGPGQVNNMFIPSLIESALRGHDFEMTKGDQTREFNYVSDIVDGFIRLGSNSRAIGRIINIGCGKDYRIIDLAEKIVSMAGSGIRLKTGKLSYRPGEVSRFYCDNTLARKLLGWKPRVSLDEGLRRTIEWWKKRIYSN
ncbi:MAG: GDP-mannose 4,6-dehydratase [Candidatus Omnitrophota bacterium]|nr:GDP-mannose 4,6-dehydratase [Candidatus Omnitrophota bacterium]